MSDARPMTPEEVAELNVVQAKVVMDVRLNALRNVCQIKAMSYTGPHEPGDYGYQDRGQIEAEVYHEVGTLLERIIQGKP